MGIDQQCSDQCSTEEEADDKGQDSVMACTKDITVEEANGKESESVKVRNKKEEGVQADEMDGPVGQIVVAAKASIIQINKVWLMLILTLVLMLMLILMLQTPKIRDRIALEREASIIQINKVRLKLMLILNLF